MNTAKPVPYYDGPVPSPGLRYDAKDGNGFLWISSRVNDSCDVYRGHHHGENNKYTSHEHVGYLSVAQFWELCR